MTHPSTDRDFRFPLPSEAETSLRRDGGDLLVKVPYGSPAHHQLMRVQNRDWDHDARAWRLQWGRDTYDDLNVRGFDVSRWPRPDRPDRCVDLVTWKEAEWLRVIVPYDNPTAAKTCGAAPGKRKGLSGNRVWLFEPSPINVRHLAEQLQGYPFHGTAEPFMRQHERFKAWVAGDAERRERAEAATFDFPFATDPYRHQRAALAFSKDREAYALFMDMGTGKTKVVIDNAEMLHAEGKVDAVVVFCPNSIKAVWADEIAVHGQQVERDVIVWHAHRSSAMRKRLRRILDEDDRSRMLWLIVNVEAMSHKSGKSLLATEGLAGRNIFMAIDESTRIKTLNAVRTKNVLACRDMAQYRRILTGTPVTQSPVDIYASFQFLDPSILGFSSKSAFEKRYSEMSMIEVPRSPGQWSKGTRYIPKVERFRNLDELNEMMLPHSYRVRKDECLDLPDKTFVRRSVTMTKAQSEAYAQMRDRMKATLGDDEEVTAAIVLTQLLRLQQIIGGWVPVDTDDDRVELRPIDGKNPRLDAVVETAEESRGKTIVWARFRAEIEGIVGRLVKAFGPDSVVEFHGGVKTDERAANVKAFQDPASPVRFFVGSQSAGGLGLTLTAASTVLYYSNTFSLEERLQSEDRAHRAGLKHPVTYVDLIAANTIDEKIVEALRSKKQIADIVTGDQWKGWI